MGSVDSSFMVDLPGVQILARFSRTPSDTTSGARHQQRACLSSFLCCRLIPIGIVF